MLLVSPLWWWRGACLLGQRFWAGREKGAVCLLGERVVGKLIEREEAKTAEEKKTYILRPLAERKEKLASIAQVLRKQEAFGQ